MSVEVRFCRWSSRRSVGRMYFVSRMYRRPQKSKRENSLSRGSPGFLRSSVAVGTSYGLHPVPTVWIVHEPRLPLSGRGVGPGRVVDVGLADPVDEGRD